MHGDPRLLHELVGPAPRLDLLWTGGAGLEGPTWQPDGSLVFSDIPNDRVLRHTLDGRTVVHAQPSHFANGHTVDLEGCLLRCEHGRRLVSRVLSDGSAQPVVDRFRGGRLNSPNDIVVKFDGTIWFTDPTYGIVSDREGHVAPSEQEGNFVFRFDPSSQEIGIATGLLDQPNGIAFPR